MQAPEDDDSLWAEWAQVLVVGWMFNVKLKREFNDALVSSSVGLSH